MHRARVGLVKQTASETVLISEPIVSARLESIVRKSRARLSAPARQTASYRAASTFVTLAKVKESAESSHPNGTPSNKLLTGASLG